METYVFIKNVYKFYIAHLYLFLFLTKTYALMIVT
jgi:hypothetical protein